MNIQNYQELTLESDTFEQVRNTFDTLLQRLFQKMEKNESDEGSITLKVDVNIISDSMDDGEGNHRIIHRPIMKHKITTSVPVKDSFDGKKDTGMALEYDEELKRFVLKYVSEGGQMSMFDKEFQENDDAGENKMPSEVDIVDGTAVDITDGDACNALGGVIADETALPGPVEGEVRFDDFNDAGGNNEDQEDDYGYDEPEW